MTSGRVDRSVALEIELWVELVLDHGPVSHQAAVGQLL